MIYFTYFSKDVENYIKREKSQLPHRVEEDMMQNNRDLEDKPNLFSEKRQRLPKK